MQHGTGKRNQKTKQEHPKIYETGFVQIAMLYFVFPAAKVCRHEMLWLSLTIYDTWKPKHQEKVPRPKLIARYAINGAARKCQNTQDLLSSVDIDLDVVALVIGAGLLPITHFLLV